jgi:hypothetical protein
MQCLVTFDNEADFTLLRIKTLTCMYRQVSKTLTHFSIRRYFWRTFPLLSITLALSLRAQVPNQAILQKVPPDENAFKRQYLARVPVVRTNDLLLSNTPQPAPVAAEIERHNVSSQTNGERVGLAGAPSAVGILENKQAPMLQSQVTRVRVEKQKDGAIARAGLNDEIWIDVRGFLPWLDLINSNRFRSNLSPYETRDLIPFFNGNPLLGIHPNYATADGEITSLRFKLSRDKDSKEGWSRLLKPTFERPIGVSVGFANKEEIPTLVVAEAADKGDSEHQFNLILIRGARFWLGLLVVFGAFLLFIKLARDTDILRDTTAPVRPDENWPYSLAKAQMAFWFFLVIAAFFFLWALTGATDTLNNSVLILIGISAGTAIGAAVIDSGKAVEAQHVPAAVPVDRSKPRAQIVAQLDKLIAQKRDQLGILEKEKSRIPSTDQTALATNQKAIEQQIQEIKGLELQRGYFSYPAWRGIMNDLLGDQGIIGFHRFQIFVWTLLLGIIFVTQVYNEFAMPAFDSTLLGLLGISAGTYVGFKIPETKRQNAAQAG